MKTIIFISLISLVLASCEKIIEANLPESNRRIVINSVFNEDSLFKVNISKSLHVLDNKDIIFLSNATVLLYENSIFIDSLKYSEGGNYFAQTFQPTIGKEYSIEVTSPDLEKASSSSFIPGEVQILSIDTLSVQRNSEDKVKCKIKFVDPSGSNYYILIIYRYYQYSMLDYGGDTLGQDSSIYAIYIDSDDPVIDTRDELNGEIIFSDEMINDKEYELSVFLPYWDLGNYDMSSDSDSVLIYFQLKSISLDLYYYYKSLALNRQTKNNPFAEPVQVYSNIKNGFGIFSGYSQYTFKMQFVGYISNGGYYEE